MIDAHLGQRDIAEIKTLKEDESFKHFLSTKQCGILIAPEETPFCNQLTVKSEAGHFAKWIKNNYHEIDVVLDPEKPKLVLHSHDVFLPLVFLASDVSFPIYLNIVSNYLYEKMKGLLEGEKVHARFSVVFEDKPRGITKRFDFEGDVNSLQKVIKRLDLNRFLDE